MSEDGSASQDSTIPEKEELSNDGENPEAPTAKEPASPTESAKNKASPPPVFSREAEKSSSPPPFSRPPVPSDNTEKVQSPPPVPSRSTSSPVPKGSTAAPPRSRETWTAIILFVALHILFGLSALFVAVTIFIDSLENPRGIIEAVVLPFPAIAWILSARFAFSRPTRVLFEIHRVFLILSLFGMIVLGAYMLRDAATEFILYALLILGIIGGIYGFFLKQHEKLI